MRRALALALVVLAGAAVGARADEIVTRTGTKLAGRVVADDGTHLVVETADLGKMKVAKADVVQINGREYPPKAAPAPAPAAAPAAATPDAAAKDRAALEAARRKAEQEAADAAARMRRRKAATLRRRTDPSEASAPVVEGPSEDELQREREREQISGAQLAATPAGSQVVLYEPPRPFPAAPSAIQLGRRTWARFDVAGAATASLTVTAGGADERLLVRLADVQRHVVARTDAARIRLLDGIDPGAWLRVRLGDGTQRAGRYETTDGETLVLRVPSEDGEKPAPERVSIPVTQLVQVDGIVPSAAVARALGDLEAGEPVGLVRWPDGREFVGRFVDRMEHHVRIDEDGNGYPECLVAVDGALAEVRRIPGPWRAAARGLRDESVVRVRGFEEYPDARVERVYVAPVAAITAYAVSVKLEDGCAVVPFDCLVALDEATQSEASAASRKLDPALLELPVLPGTPAGQAATVKLPEGVSFVGDGERVTHVYVAAACERPVCGLRVGMAASQALPYAEITFGTEVLARGENGAAKSRELISESVEGYRVTAYVDGRGILEALEITKR